MPGGMMVSVELEVEANEDILDLLYYRDQLNRDIMRFFSPWAFRSERRTGAVAEDLCGHAGGLYR